MQTQTAAKSNVSLHRDTPRSRFRPEPKNRLRLNARDLELLAFLHDNHLASRSQIQQMFYGSKAYCNFRLRALFDHAVVLRHFPSLTLSGNWGEEAIYTLGPGALWALAGHLEEDAETLSSYVRRHRSPALISHSLHVVQIYLAFRKSLTSDSRLSLERWVGENGARHEYQRRKNERWETEIFKPDGFLRLKTRTKPLRHFPFFIECDLGHTSKQSWKVKVSTYLKYAGSGLFSSTYGQEKFETLVVTTGEKRLEHLMEATGEVGGHFFRFSTWSSLGLNPLESIWLSPGYDSPRPLISL